MQLLHYKISMVMSRHTDYILPYLLVEVKGLFTQGSLLE